MLLIESLMVSVIFTVSKDSCSPFPFLFLVQILLLAAFFLPPLGSYRVTYVKRQRLVLQSHLLNWEGQKPRSFKQEVESYCDDLVHSYL